MGLGLQLALLHCRYMEGISDAYDDLVSGASSDASVLMVGL